MDRFVNYNYLESSYLDQCDQLKSISKGCQKSVFSRFDETSKTIEMVPERQGCLLILNHVFRLFLETDVSIMYSFERSAFPPFAWYR